MSRNTKYTKYTDDELIELFKPGTFVRVRSNSPFYGQQKNKGVGKVLQLHRVSYGLKLKGWVTVVYKGEIYYSYRIGLRELKNIDKDDAGIRDIEIVKHNDNNDIEKNIHKIKNSINKILKEIEALSK